MSDLTRLNPTPHAIAVYASQPPSPVATQHSLPSRTLPFTWAGLSPAGSHQLCLAHSFDHLVGEGEQLWRNVDAERLGGVEIDHQSELGGLNDRHLRRVGATSQLSKVHGLPVGSQRRMAKLAKNSESVENGNAGNEPPAER